MEKSFLQREAELSRFEDGKGSISSDVRSDETDEVPVYHPQVFDPSNPEADWAGNVPKKYSRRLYAPESTSIHTVTI